MGYTISASGVPALVASANTDSAPSGMTIDASGKFFVASTGAGTVNGYTFGSSGEPITSSVSTSYQVGTGPTCLSMIGAPSTGEPTHAIYLYALPIL